MGLHCEPSLQTSDLSSSVPHTSLVLPGTVESLQEAGRGGAGPIAVVELVHELDPVEAQRVEERRERLHAHEHPDREERPRARRDKHLRSKSAREAAAADAALHPASVMFRRVWPILTEDRYGERWGNREGVGRAWMRTRSGEADSSPISTTTFSQKTSESCACARESAQRRR